MGKYPLKISILQLYLMMMSQICISWAQHSVCTPAGETMLRPWQDTPQMVGMIEFDTYSFLPAAVFPARHLWPLWTSPKHFLLPKIIWWLINVNIPVKSWKGMLGSMVVGETIQEWGIH